MAQAQAFARDTVLWFGGALSALVTGAVTARVLGKKTPPALAAPVAALSVLTAYQWDMAYGSKLERINAHFDTIVRDEGAAQHWFVPLLAAAEKKPKNDD